MPYIITSADGPEVKTFADGTYLDLYQQVDDAQSVIAQMPDPSRWSVQPIVDQLAWLVEMFRSGVTHVNEVAAIGDETNPQDIHLLISQSRVSGTIEGFPFE
jgi:hypothetical protein